MFYNLLCLPWCFTTGSEKERSRDCQNNPSPPPLSTTTTRLIPPISSLPSSIKHDKTTLSPFSVVLFFFLLICDRRWWSNWTEEELAGGWLPLPCSRFLCSYDRCYSTDYFRSCFSFPIRNRSKPRGLSEINACPSSRFLSHIGVPHRLPSCFSFLISWRDEEDDPSPIVCVLDQTSPSINFKRTLMTLICICWLNSPIL